MQLYKTQTKKTYVPNSHHMWQTEKQKWTTNKIETVYIFLIFTLVTLSILLYLFTFAICTLLIPFYTVHTSTHTLRNRMKGQSYKLSEELRALCCMFALWVTFSEGDNREDKVKWKWTENSVCLSSSAGVGCIYVLCMYGHRVESASS